MRASKRIIAIIVVFTLIIFAFLNIPRIFAKIPLAPEPLRTNAYEIICNIQGQTFIHGSGCSSDNTYSISPNGSLTIPKKPVIYLYPTHPKQIQVTVNYFPGFLATYPSYKDGWSVTAYPDGKLINNADNKEYSYLYWEGNPDKNASYNLSTGFVIKGEDTALFLQEKLSKIGLIPKEYNEFIVYWLPHMQNNKYNLIHFATDEEYGDKVKMNISPKPDSMLRVFMVFKPINHEVEVKPQTFSIFKRIGFSVIEWGGTELK